MTPAHNDNAVTPIDPYEVMIGGVKADPYRIAKAYGGFPEPIFQALKKILRCGRKHKDMATDIRQAVTSLERWEEMEAEDAEFERLKEERIEV